MLFILYYNTIVIDLCYGCQYLMFNVRLIFVCNEPLVCVCVYILFFVKNVLGPIIYIKVWILKKNLKNKRYWRLFNNARKTHVPNVFWEVGKYPNISWKCRQRPLSRHFYNVWKGKNPDAFKKFRWDELTWPKKKTSRNLFLTYFLVRKDLILVVLVAMYMYRG